MVEKIKNYLKWRTIDTYILKKFLGSVVYSITLLMAIIVVVDLSENLQRFLEFNVPTKDVLLGYYLNFIPYFANLFIPLFTFISVIWFTSKLSSNNEIVAMLNSGISFYRILYPYMVGALIVAMFAMFMSSYVVPKASKRLYTFKEIYMYEGSRARVDIHVKNSPTSYIFLERWDKDENTGYQFTYEELGEKSLNYKISAQRIVYNTNKDNWTLYNCVERRIVNDEEVFSQCEQKDTSFNLRPYSLNRDVYFSETMITSELNKFIKEEKEKGSTLVNHYIIEQQKRLANSFGTIIMTIFALSVASRKTRRGVGVHVFIGMGLAFTFVFLQQVSTVFSVAGTMPPGLGAWMPDILSMILCIYLLRSTPK